MPSNKNIYNYKTPQSGEEETRFFSSKGRITPKAFWLRFLLVLCIYFLSSLINSSGLFSDSQNRYTIFFEVFHLNVLPIILLIFLILQGYKRIHDINKPGWNFLIPFYGIYLCSLKGTKGNNDFGIDPAPGKEVQFFDELPQEEPVIKREQKVKSPKKSKSKGKKEISSIPLNRYLSAAMFFINLFLILQFVFYVNSFRFAKSVAINFLFRPHQYFFENIFQFQSLLTLFFSVILSVLYFKRKYITSNGFLYYSYFLIIMVILFHSIKYGNIFPLPKQSEHPFIQNIENNYFNRLPGVTINSFHRSNDVSPNERYFVVKGRASLEILHQNGFQLDHTPKNSSDSCDIYFSSNGEGSIKISINNNKYDLYTFRWTSMKGLTCFIKWFNKKNGITADNNLKYQYRVIRANNNTIWMAENLREEFFRNGDPIPNQNSTPSWVNAVVNNSPAWCYYDTELSNERRFGKLYNWHVVNDKRGLAPKGWKIPSENDLNLLISELGEQSIAGKKMKNRDGWMIENNNESGFSALPGGSRNVYGQFEFLNFNGLWWLSDQLNSRKAKSFKLRYNDNSVAFEETFKGSGLSIRCVAE